MANITDSFVAETLECFESFPLHELDGNWLHSLWMNQFSTLDEYPSSETDIFSEGLFEPIANAIIICERWAEETVEKSVSRIDESNDTLELSSKLLWTALAENEVELKNILGFIYAVCSISIKNDAIFYQKEMGLKCAKLYLTMLRIPGSAAYSVFHPSLLKLVFDCFKFPKEKVPGKKKAPTSAYRNDIVSQRKRVRRQDDDDEYGDENADKDKNFEPNETEFGQKECDDILDGFSDVLVSVIPLLQSFSLINNIELVEHMIDKLFECIAVEIRYSDFNFNRNPLEILELKRRKGLTYVVAGLAYCSLLSLCQPLHGNVPALYLHILSVACGLILCTKAKGLPNATIPHKYITVRDHVLDFVCFNIDKNPTYSIRCSKILVQKLCSRCCDKTAFREKTAAAVFAILKRFPALPYAQSVEWLVRFATQKPPDKVMALEVMSLLIMEPERKVPSNFPKKWLIYITHIPIAHTIIDRCCDKGPTVRAKALSVLTTGLDTICRILCLSPVQRMENIKNNLVDDNEDDTEPMEVEETQETNKNNDDDDFVLEEENDDDEDEYSPHQDFKLCEINEFVEMILTRTADFKVHVRKSALQAFQQLILYDEKYVLEEFLTFFHYGSKDSNITVRRTAVECLTKILKKYNTNTLVHKVWLKNVLPTALDAEKSVQAKALEEMESLFLLDGRNSAMKKCSWSMLNSIACGESHNLLLYLRKAFSLWKSEGKLKPNLSRILETELQTENEAAAWMLLDILSQNIEIKNMTAVMNAWEASRGENLPSRTLISMLSVIGYGAKYMKPEQLIQLQVYFEHQIRNYTCSNQLISDTILTLLKIYKAQHKKNDDALKRTINNFSSEIIQVSEKFLTDLISENAPTEDAYSEELIYRHLTTISELILLAPCYAAEKLCLILQGIIVSNSPSNDNANSNTVFQSLPYSSKIQSYACLALGKLCLMDEDSAKKCVAVFNRELSTSKYPGVRITIVTVFSDLCVRYTLMVDRYIPSISTCLKDENTKVRLHTLSYLARLLQEDYIKLKDTLLCRLLTTIIDPVGEIRSMAEYCLGNLLIKRQPTLFIQHFVECIFFLNCCSGVSSLQFNQRELDVKLFSMKGKKNLKRRMAIYNFMIKYTPSVKRPFITLKLCSDILHAVTESAMPLSKSVEDVVRDCLMILTSEELKPTQSQANAGDEGDDAEASEAAASMSKTAHKMSIVGVSIPIVMTLKKVLSEIKSPLIPDLLHFLCELYKDYKNEVKDVLASDRQLAQEVEYEIKKFEKEQEKKKPDSEEIASNENDIHQDVALSVSNLRNKLQNISIMSQTKTISAEDKKRLINEARKSSPVVVLNRITSPTTPSNKSIIENEQRPTVITSDNFVSTDIFSRPPLVETDTPSVDLNQQNIASNASNISTQPTTSRRGRRGTRLQSNDTENTEN